jgi:fatty acid amide hydrolase
MLWRLSASSLSSMLARGEVSAAEVARAHIDRIDRIDGVLHAFTEVWRDQAMADAEAADMRRRSGRARGALDGLPVSIKECFDVAGRPTTLGLPSWRSRIAPTDAAMVVALRDAGAVLLGRTNLSQTMLYVEARNPVYGQTANPWSLDHSPGGSSGGEAAAIAAGMSPLGAGTDIGGSIRTPAHFCGIAGIKPSLDRLPMRGYRSVNPGQEAVRATGGPMARTVADLALFMRALDPRRSSALDPRVPPVAWEEPETVGLRGLRVGMYVDDGVLAPSASVARAVERAAAALVARGCEVHPFRPPDVRGLLADYLGALSADGGVAIRAALAGGQVDPVLEPLRRMAQVPAGVRRVASRAALALGQVNAALLLDALGERSVGELWQITARLRSRRDDLVELMNREGIEALLCPAYATPAVPHGATRGFTLASSYSILFNAVPLPAGVVPVTRVRGAEARRVADRDRLTVLAARVDEKSAGLPVGVQVVARAWKDHVVLALMGAIEAEVSTDAEFPRTPVEPGPAAA